MREQYGEVDIVGFVFDGIQELWKCFLILWKVCCEYYFWNVFDIFYQVDYFVVIFGMVGGKVNVVIVCYDGGDVV